MLLMWGGPLEPGDVETEFAQIGTARVLKEFLTYGNPGPLYLPKGKGLGHPIDSPIELPSWLSEEECDYYASKYEKTGVTGGLNYYRNLDLYGFLQLLPIKC
ncbi:bifunctional epoxide hydrolase 2 [Spatholobus suberectus]|nr:bifunctional epoxide hydrolase 2 [Spatholobus suberectus]